MQMSLSNEGLDFIKQREGFRASVYADVAGFRTIGYGHLVKPTETFPACIGEAEADALLARDVVNAELVVDNAVHVDMTQGEYDALVDFVFNLGDRLDGSTLLRLLNAGQTIAAEQELKRWDFAGGKPCAGLLARRVLEMQLWERGANG